MRIILGSILSLALATQASPPAYPPAFPRPNATRLLETDRFRVWDIVWPQGQPTALHRHVYDQVGTYYQAGGRVITNVDGSKRSATTQVGALSTTRRGTTHIEEGATDPPLRAVFIELKSDEPSGLPDVRRNVPPPFPREGTTERLNDDRVIVWEHTWRPGARSAPAAYGYEMLWVWLDGGTVEIGGSDGSFSSLTVAPGQIRHVRRGTVESDHATVGSPRAMIFAFK
jgi:hypothetical protein